MEETETKIEESEPFAGPQEEQSEAAKYLREVLAFLPLAICDLSISGMVGNINNAFEELTGLGINEAVGQYVADFFVETSRVNNILKLAQKESMVRNKELTLVTKGKKKVPVTVSFSIKRDIEGNFTGYLVSITDISGLKESQAEIEKKIKARTKDLEESRRALLNMLEDTEASKIEIEEEKSKTQIIFDNFLDGLLIFTPDQRLEQMNLKAEEYLEVSKKKLLGRSIEEMEKEPEMKDLIGIVKKRTDKVFRQELSFEKKELVLEVTSQSIEYGKRPVVLIVLHDISREKVIERLKSQFVSVAAHQLRTPLSILKWSLSMLIGGEMGSVGEEQKEILLKANQTNERMIRLINDLLNVARIEEGRFVYQPKVVDLGEVVERVVKNSEDLIKERKIKFKVNIEEKEVPKIIKADIEKLTLTIKNLVENAIRYTDVGGDIAVSLGKKDNKVEFSIKDSGIGIPKEQQDRVFTKFFRGDNAVRKETEGTGLGLFICKNIIEAHDGKVWFESEENKGTTFSFSLPTIA